MTTYTIRYRRPEAPLERRYHGRAERSGGHDDTKATLEDARLFDHRYYSAARDDVDAIETMAVKETVFFPVAP